MESQKQMGPGKNGRKGGQQRPASSPHFLNRFFDDTAHADNSEARLKKALDRFYFQRLSADWLCRMVNGLESDTAARIAELFNKPENTCTDPAMDKDTFLRSTLQTGGITINDPQVFDRTLIFLQLNADLYASRKSVFESLDGLIARYVKAYDKRNAAYGIKADMFACYEKAIEVLEAAHTGALTRDMGRFMRKTILIATNHPDMRNYNLEYALDNLSSAMGGMTHKKLSTMRAALGFEIKETPGAGGLSVGNDPGEGWATVGYERGITSVNECGIRYGLVPVYGTVGTCRRIPKIVLREKAGKKLLRFAIAAGAISWAVGYFFNFPPPQRFIIPSQRAAFVKEFKECSWGNIIENLQSAEEAYRHDAKHGKAP